MRIHSLAHQNPTHDLLSPHRHITSTPLSRHPTVTTYNSNRSMILYNSSPVVSGGSLSPPDMYWTSLVMASQYNFRKSIFNIVINEHIQYCIFLPKLTIIYWLQTNITVKPSPQWINVICLMLRFSEINFIWKVKQTSHVTHDWLE